MDEGEYYNYLRFCPECGQPLETHPIVGNFACFLHGDFIIRDGKVIWNFTKNLIKRGD